MASLIFLQGCLEDLLDYEMEQYDIVSPFGITFGTFQVSFIRIIRNSGTSQILLLVGLL